MKTRVLVPEVVSGTDGVELPMGMRVVLSTWYSPTAKLVAVCPELRLRTELLPLGTGPSKRTLAVLTAAGQPVRFIEKRAAPAVAPADENELAATVPSLTV